MHLFVKCAADGLGQPQAIAGVSGWRQRNVALAGRDVRVDAPLEFVVGGKAPTGEHDAAANSDLQPLAVPLHDRPGDTVAAVNQLDDG